MVTDVKGLSVKCVHHTVLYNHRLNLPQIQAHDLLYVRAVGLMKLSHLRLICSASVVLSQSMAASTLLASVVSAVVQAATSILCRPCMHEWQIIRQLEIS